MRGILKTVRGVWRLGRRRGAHYFAYLLMGYVVPRLAYWLLNEVPRWHLRIAMRLCLLFVVLALSAVVSMVVNWTMVFGFLVVLALLFKITKIVLRELAVRSAVLQARSLSAEPHHAHAHTMFARWLDLPVDATTRARVDAARKQNAGLDLVLGRVDSDGRVLWLFGPILPQPTVSASEFRERSRFAVDIVLCGEDVTVRKDYRGDRASLAREWLNLLLLRGKANVPSLHHVDERGCRLYRNLVLGKTVREVLVEAGAAILDAQTKDDPEMQGLSQQARIENVWKRGRTVIPLCLSDRFLEEFERQLNLIHGAGVVGVSVTYGNIIVEARTGAPWFIDLEKGRFYAAPRGWRFAYRRDQDRTKFNRCYGRSLITERSARAALAEQSAKLNGWYAPIDFGNGLVTPGFWSTDSGMGRWQYFNGPILDELVRGRRVLDLGSQNGIMPLMMLRAGASEVLGLDRSHDYVSCAHLVHRLFEWRDMRGYNLRLRQGDMVEILHGEWGNYDLITAFCSLYYLTPSDMAAVVRRAAELAPILVVQAKTDTRKEAADDKALKSSVRFLKEIMERNGFRDVEVHERRGFTRPLLIGRRSQA